MEDATVRLMRLLLDDPDRTQRELAQGVGLSLGALNYCLRALTGKGLVKMRAFSRSKNKLGYVYVLTPAGVAEKSVLTRRFLERKLAEFHALEAEIKAVQGGLGHAEQAGDGRNGHYGHEGPVVGGGAQRLGG